METFCVLLSLVVLAAAQLHHQVPLKEVRHLQALQQPHLPRDSNVVQATQQFLNRFAQLKALADAAPDPPQNQNRQSATQNRNHLPGQHVFTLHGQVGSHQNPAIFTSQHQQHQQQLQRHQQQLQQHQQQQAQHPNNRQASHHAVVPAVNAQGIVVNPNGYPGPLAHHLPANVG